MAVAVGPDINDAELEQIAMGNPKIITHVSDFQHLKLHLNKILEDSCEGNVNQLHVNAQPFFRREVKEV